MADPIRSEEDIVQDINTITVELKEILEYANQQFTIFKEDNEGGKSELINYVENAGEEENLRNDWATVMI